jgi:hypothetical protein
MIKHSIPEPASTSTEACEAMDAVRREHERMVESLAAGSAASYWGPSAEGVTLYGGLANHPGDGDVMRIVDEAMSSLEKQYTSGSGAARRRLSLPRLPR